MHLSGVRPSVRLSQLGPQLLWRGRQEISIDCCTAHSNGGRMRAVPRCQRT